MFICIPRAILDSVLISYYFSAAHCVTRDTGEALPKDDIIVAVGKYYNKYKDPRDSQAQYSNVYMRLSLSFTVFNGFNVFQVAKIDVPERYKGDSQRFASDIAILVTKDILLLSKVVQPVCYQGVDHFNLNPTHEGVVSIWLPRLDNTKWTFISIYLF